MGPFRIFEILRKHRDNILFGFCAVFAFFLLTFTHSDSRNGLERFGFTVLSSVQKGWFAGVDFLLQKINSISELKQLKSEYDALKDRFDEQHRFLDTIEGLKAENELLKEQMYISDRLEYEHITTDVIAKDPGNFLSYVKIGCGSARNTCPSLLIREGITDWSDWLLNPAIRLLKSCPFFPPIFP